MLIAKIDGSNITVGDYRELFPNTSFPVTGPNDDFYAENGFARVSTFKVHDRSTEMLIGCDPYLDGDMVYTVQVVAKPEPTPAVVPLETAQISSMGTGA